LRVMFCPCKLIIVLGNLSRNETSLCLSKPIGHNVISPITAQVHLLVPSQLAPWMDLCTISGQALAGNEQTQWAWQAR
jgi:hypothetical protein